MYKLLKKKIAINRRKLISSISPTYATKYFYKKTFKRPLNLNNPKTLNEKILWLKLNTYKNNSLITECADKYLVRNYISRLGCNEILNDLIDVWDSVEEIEWNYLPDKFALKVNHGSGYNIICDNLIQLNREATEEQLNKWLKEDYWKLYAEINYKDIPKKIICEKYIETQNSLLPDDYKIYCFNGVPKLIMLCIGREKGRPQFYFYDKNWNMMPYTKDALENPTLEIKKPVGIDEMFKYAEILSKPFPFVRTDFYLNEGNVIFGELTFTPSGGLDKNRLPKTDLILGELLKLPIENK